MISQGAKKAIYIGSLCSISYFAVYIARNILGAVTPQMVEGGYSEEYIGRISFVYLMTYAIGQLVNGAIGDRIKARWMICIGLFGGAATNFSFSLTASNESAAMILYGSTGFFLSMIYGSMTKLVSENTEPIYTARCSLGYTFASFFGSPAAGLLASLLAWQSVFAVSSSVLVIMATTVFISFFLLERRGIIKYGQYKPEGQGKQGVGILFKHQIVKFSLVAMLTGVIRTSVVFWLPTYIAQHLSFQANEATGIFSAATVFISLSAFIAVFIYERLGRNMSASLLLTFSLATVFFALTYFVSFPIFNIIFIVLAITFSDGAASILWSVYCPSLRDTGMVSSATGFLDFLSYVAAAVANLLFGSAATSIGWENLILVWTAIVAFGVIVALPYNKIRLKKQE